MSISHPEDRENLCPQTQTCAGLSAKEFPGLFALADRYGEKANRVSWRHRLAAAALLFKVAGLNYLAGAQKYKVSDFASQASLPTKLLKLLAALNPREQVMFARAICTQLVNRCRGDRQLSGFPAKDFPRLWVLASHFGDRGQKLSWRQRFSAAALLLRLASLNVTAADPEYTLADLLPEFPELAGPRQARLRAFLPVLSPEEQAMFVAAILAQLGDVVQVQVCEVAKNG